MRKQQVSVNVPLMLKTALMYLCLAISGWMLLRLLQACLWFPSYLKNQVDVPRKSSLDGDAIRVALKSEEDEKKNI